MKKLPARWLFIPAAAVLVIAALYGVWQNRTHTSAGADMQAETFNAAPPQTARLSAWIADWNWKVGMEDFSKLSGRLDEVQMFAAYFDAEDHLYFTPTYKEALPNLRNAAASASVSSLVLTVVNDRYQADGTPVQKDPQLVSRLLGSKQSRTDHIEELAQAVQEGGFQGLEIDYEKIDKQDYGRLVLFIKELHQRLGSNGRTLRVVLEPGMPIETMKLPEGPSYVMMAYNLYGTHSGPGPKADLGFIRKLAVRMSKLPGEPSIAFATGGFDWPSSGKITALTELEAEAIAARQSASVSRDAASGAVYYTYSGSDGVSHTVWYADGITLYRWIQAANQKGIRDISLWRLGGFSPSTVKTLSKL